jgi:hypothetical protein
MSKKPLVDAGIRTEFGEYIADETDSGRTPDVMYTPGFSDMRVARDTAMAEVHKGSRKKEDVPTLTHNVRLFRRAKASGTPDQSRQFQASAQGYRLITDADVGQPWFKEVPPGTEKLAGGGYAKGDLVYMVADAATAARSQGNKLKAMMDLAGTEFAKPESLGSAGGSIEKLDATVPFTGVFPRKK